MGWLTRGRSCRSWRTSAANSAPAVLKAVAAGLLKPQGHKFKVTAKGGDRSRIRRMAAAAALWQGSHDHARGHRLRLHPALRGESIAYGGLALAWSLYNALILTVVCFVCIELPRKRKAERFDRSEAILLQPGRQVASGAACRHFHHRRAADRSRSSRFRRRAIECRIYGRSIAGMEWCDAPRIRFAVRFEEGMDTRVHAIRAFYAGEYVRAYSGVRALPVGKALLMRLFG